MGAGLVRDHLLRPQSGIGPEGPGQRRVSRDARRLFSRTCQGAGARFLSLHPKAQRPEHRDWISLCARTGSLMFDSFLSAPRRHFHLEYNPRAQELTTLSWSAKSDLTAYKLVSRS